MAQKTIYPNGTEIILVPQGQQIAIANFGGGIAEIYYLITSAGTPDAYRLQQTLNNSSVTLGTFSADQTVKIEAKSSTVFYDVAVSPDTGIGDADTLNGMASATASTADTIVARDSNADIFCDAANATSVVVDGDADANISIDANTTSDDGQLLFSAGGSTKGKIIYDHNATPANETIKFNVAGVTQTRMSIKGDGTLYQGTTNEIWHEGNDGSGSGLDADTVDGVEAADIVQLAGSQTVTGTKTFSAGSPEVKVVSTSSSGVSRISIYSQAGGGTYPVIEMCYDDSTDIAAIKFPNQGMRFVENVSGSETEMLQITAGGSFQAHKDIYVGLTKGGDSIILFYDNNSTTWRSLKWADTANEWRVEDAAGVDRTLWHSGLNASVGSGNGVSGTFTTVDGKTVTYTNGIITGVV